MQITFNSLNILLIVFAVTSIVTFSACQKQDRNTLLVKDSSTSIPLQRTGLDGTYDSSGLAKRVALALENDPILMGISSVYVAQTDSTIVLKGTLSNQTFLERMITVARGVKGVTKVDTSQVRVTPPSSL